MVMDLYEAIKAGRVSVPYHGPPLLRFLSQVDKNGPEHVTQKCLGKCWVWTGARWAQGYGQMKIKGKPIKTHRFAYENLIGPINGLWVLHSCDNKLCINPKHLFLGTPTDNHKDMVAKRRHAWGERNGNAILTAAQVQEIRSLYVRRDNRRCQRALADRFGVSEITISRIILKENWK